MGPVDLPEGNEGLHVDGYHGDLRFRRREAGRNWGHDA
jgi:hypothetical protein